MFKMTVRDWIGLVGFLCVAMSCIQTTFHSRFTRRKTFEQMENMMLETIRTDARIRKLEKRAREATKNTSNGHAMKTYTAVRTPLSPPADEKAPDAPKDI